MELSRIKEYNGQLKPYRFCGAVCNAMFLYTQNLSNSCSCRRQNRKSASNERTLGQRNDRLSPKWRLHDKKNVSPVFLRTDLPLSYNREISPVNFLMPIASHAFALSFALSSCNKIHLAKMKRKLLFLPPPIRTHVLDKTRSENDLFWYLPYLWTEWGKKLVHCNILCKEIGK